MKGLITLAACAAAFVLPAVAAASDARAPRAMHDIAYSDARAPRAIHDAWDDARAPRAADVHHGKKSSPRVSYRTDRASKFLLAHRARML